MANLEYHIGQRGYPGYTVSIATLSGSATPPYANFRTVVPAHVNVDSTGAESGTATNPMITAGASSAATAGVSRSGTATTTSGGLSVAARAGRRPGDLQGQNVSAVTIGFNEFGGTAAIGALDTYTVAAGGVFSITTNRIVNFIAASGTAAVTMTDVA